MSISLDHLKKTMAGYCANSKNDDKYPHLWLESASAFINQMSQMNKYVPQEIKINAIEDFIRPGYKSLGKLFEKYGSDKSTIHNYHIFYNYIFTDLQKIQKLKLLEIGIGTNDPTLVSSMGRQGSPGASLRTFRDFLSVGEIYGADVDKNILFEEERIKTSYVDQFILSTFQPLKSQKYDIIIDDGHHSIGANINTLNFALETINGNGWIIIEDIRPELVPVWKSIALLLGQNMKYEIYIIKSNRAYLFAVKIKP